MKYIPVHGVYSCSWSIPVHHVFLYIKYIPALSVLLLLTPGPAGLEGPIGRSTVGAASIYSGENTQETEI